MVLEFPDLKLLFSPPTPRSPDSHFKYYLTPASCTQGGTDFFIEKSPHSEPRGKEKNKAN